MTRKNNPNFDPIKIIHTNENMTLEEIEKLSDSERWKILRQILAKKNPADNRYQVHFTGFNKEDKAELKNLTHLNEKFKKVESVTQGLTFLVYGETASEKKIKKAKQQDVEILNKAEYLQLLETGELP